MMNRSCTEMNEFEVESLDSLIVVSYDLYNNKFGVDFIGRKLELSFMYFFRLSYKI